MKKVHCLTILCLALLSSCRKGADNATGLQEITLEPHFVEDALPLCDEFTTVEIIPFENKTECMLTEVKKLMVTDAGIYVFDASPSPRILSFRHDGRFKNEIGSRGHAKGEYQMVLNMGATANGDTVAVVGYPEILLYAANGRYLASLPVKDNNGVEDVLFADGRLYLGYFHRQEKCMMSLYESRSMEHVADMIETPVDPIGASLGVDNGHLLQEDGGKVYCPDVLNSCFYVCDKSSTGDVAKYSIGLEEMLREKDVRDNADTEEKAYRIASYQACDGVVRGVIEHGKGYYDFRFALSDKTVDIMRHNDWDYSFDCCHSGSFYTVVSASTLLDYMDKDKKYMEPVRKLLGNTLGEMEGKVSPTDNYYLIKMRLKHNL